MRTSYVAETGNKKKKTENAGEKEKFRLYKCR